MTSEFDNEIILLEEVDSTQKRAKEIISEGNAKNGLVIRAKTQTGGIGRLDRLWASPPGGLWMTTIYQGDYSLELFQGFSVFLGLEIVEQLTKKLHLNFKIKWPNDLILNNKKIGGILIDAISKGDRLNYLIIGIGINLNIESDSFPKELQTTATSISIEQNDIVNIEDIFSLVLNAQNKIFRNPSLERNIDIWGSWSLRSYTFNSEVIVDMFDEKIIGIEKGITSKGELLISFETGETRTISAGEIQLLRKMD